MIRPAGIRFLIGTRFLTSGRHPRLCAVTDIYRTYNTDNELVDVRYVAEHEFCGQKVTEYGIPDATVAMGIQNLREKGVKTP